MKLTCGVTIPTHNRRDDLQRTCAMLAGLMPPPDEILICADACADGTAEFIRQSHPECRLFVNRDSRGSIGSRDAMMRQASSDILLSLDDDSYPLESDAIERMRELFTQNPRLAIAEFPQRSDEQPATLSQPDFGPPHFIGTFSNASAAIRRRDFLKVGGYPVLFHHAYEEPDLALRCVAARLEVRFEPALTVRHHYTGVGRNEMRTHHFHARNELWSVMMRCPAPHLFSVAAFRLVRQLGYARKRGMPWLLREPVWWGRFLRGLPRALARREPIPWPRYRAWMELVRRPVFSADEWAQCFRPGSGRRVKGRRTNSE